MGLHVISNTTYIIRLRLNLMLKFSDKQLLEFITFNERNILFRKVF
jgi:hypothetical protein